MFTRKHLKHNTISKVYPVARHVLINISSSNTCYETVQCSFCRRRYRSHMEKVMKNSGLIVGATVLSILSAVSSAFAIPSLQLDIKGGTYDSASETIVSKTGSFTLYAYLIPDASAPLVGTYYVSAAILPAVSSSTSLGSFKFDGTTVNATSDMTFGTPPVCFTRINQTLNRTQTKDSTRAVFSI